MAWLKEIPCKRYPSDLTDEEWEILEPILKKARSLYEWSATSSRSPRSGKCHFLPEQDGLSVAVFA